MGVWALVPWTRHHRRNQPSNIAPTWPSHHRLHGLPHAEGMGCRGERPAPRRCRTLGRLPGRVRLVALGLASVVALLGSRTNSAGCFFSGAALLQVVLNGVFGLDYSEIALLLVMAGLSAVTLRQSRRTAGGADECSVRAAVALGRHQSGAAQDDGKLPASVEKLFEEKGPDRQAHPGRERGYLKKLPPHAQSESRRTSMPSPMGGAKRLKALLSSSCPRRLRPSSFRTTACSAIPTPSRRSPSTSSRPTQRPPTRQRTESQGPRERRAAPPGVVVRGAMGLQDNDVMTADIAAPSAQGGRARRGPHLDLGVLRPLPRGPQLHARLGPTPFPPTNWPSTATASMASSCSGRRTPRRRNA